ncbi:MAG: hypothetical protein IIY78_03580 [Clostridia bacterium]|nr:hypothetical protein [Clostridia bacterium]
MSDLSAQINSVLQDPGAMEKIKQLSGLLGQNVEQKPASSNDNLSAIINALGGSGSTENKGIKPNDASGLISLLQSAGDSRQEKLLEAIKPFLSEQRRAKLEQAERILRIIRLIPILKSSGILNFI